MLNTQKLQALVIISMFLFASCKKDQDPIIIVPPSTGSTLVLNGLTGIKQQHYYKCNQGKLGPCFLLRQRI